MARWQKLGVIAGGGALPARIAASCQSRGADFHLIRLSGYVDAALNAFPGDDCAIGEIGKMLRALTDASCDAVVFCGIVHRPNFSAVKADWRGAALLPKVVAAAARGDGAILDVVVEAIEAEGMTVIGAEEAIDGLAAEAGSHGAHRPGPEDVADIRKASRIIDALGPFDIGQAAIVARGFVLAIEAAEGTDAMLTRCASLVDLKEEQQHCGVLVKQPKPGQELRIDLPVIGPQTIEKAATAGLAGVAVKAGHALVVDRDETIEKADKAGLFIYGFEDRELAGA